MPQIAVENPFQLKALSMGSERRFGGILVPFGDTDDRDLDDEWFDENTQDVDQWFKMLGAVPFLLDHDKGREIMKMLGLEIPSDVPFEGPVGKITKLEKTAEGWYAEGELAQVSDKLRQAYIDYVWAEIQKGNLNFSSTGWQNGIKRTKSGYIAKWPVVEGTATWRPANPKKTGIDVKSYKSALDFLHIPTIPVNEELTGEEPAEESVAHKMSESIDEQTRRVYQAWGDQYQRKTELPSESRWIVERYPDYVIVCEGAEHYKVPYLMTDEAVTFVPKEQWREVRREWVEVSDDAEMEMALGNTDVSKALALIKLYNVELELLNHELRRVAG